MNNDLETIYKQFKNMYEAAKDAALVKRDLNIQNGSDISLEIKKCNDTIDDCNKKLEMGDIIFRFILLHYLKNNYDKPIDLDYIFSKIQFKLTSKPK